MVIRDSPDDPWYQIGLVSFGLENICGGAKNREKKPGVFTKVVKYLPTFSTSCELEFDVILMFHTWMVEAINNRGECYKK